MFPKSSRQVCGRNAMNNSGGSVEAMDEYLYAQNLWRKIVPRDESSLFRIVSEQVS